MISGKPTCIWCGDDAGDPKYWVNFLGRALYFCPTDYTLMKQLFKNMRGIREGLHQQGIHIGVPKTPAKDAQ